MLKLKSISIQTNELQRSFFQINRERNQKINKILGTNFEDKYINKILKNLDFQFLKNLNIPSWRSDIETVNDLAEEIARVIGYNNIKRRKINISKDVVRNIDSKIK